MELIPSTIIIFIGFSQFSFLLADKKLPADNGRFEMAKCLGKSLSWEYDEFFQTETYLYQFCEDAIFGVAELFKKDRLGQDIAPDDVFRQVRDCLNSHNHTELIERYENFTPDHMKNSEGVEGVQSVPEMFKLATGLCETKELVKYNDLDDDDEKSKSLQCLQNCAVNLFGRFELVQKALQPNNDNTSIAEDEGQDQPKPSTTSSTIQQYTDDCEKKEETVFSTDISFLSETGKKYAGKYIDDINKLYNAHPNGDTKINFFGTIFSYLGCVKWTCAMKSSVDVPFFGLIEDTIGVMSQADEKLLDK
ncbi:uncharacterized protein LOC135833968 [Planococcus citri]|uniref:uncharacterized protein LOC135833968 n=1 Tax=Planococcus citri TaxID=170843 RepID=UPI0031F9B2EF